MSLANIQSVTEEINVKNLAVLNLDVANFNGSSVFINNIINTTMSGPWGATTFGVSLIYNKIGRSVTLSLTGGGSLSTNTSVNTFITVNTVLPVNVRPLYDVIVPYGFYTQSAATTGLIGSLLIDSASGEIKISALSINKPQALSGFVSAAGLYLNGCSVSYISAV